MGSRKLLVIAAAVVMTAAVASGVTHLPSAKADVLAPQNVTDCSADVGHPASGSIEFDVADKNNFYCGYEGYVNYNGNPAETAATAANTANGVVGTPGNYIGDPFREPALRWAVAGRGDYKVVSWKNSQGRTSLTGGGFDAVLLSPVVTTTNPGPFPGIVIPCHSCFVSAVESDQFALAESLAEAGYVVMIPYVGGNSTQSTKDATDFFLARPDRPDFAGEYNPWWQRLDGSRLGITGHSGAGGLALEVGNDDPRFSAVVGLDPAFGGLEGISLRTPTMIQVADYNGNLGRALPPQVESLNSALPLPALTFLPYGPNAVRHTYPTPTPDTKYTYFDSYRARAENVDAMQVSIRSTTHIDFGRPSGGAFSTYGEMVEIYYALAWFDHYVRGAADPTAAQDSLRRLTSTAKFDTSADVHSIGTGFFDEVKAKDGGSVEAGNVPITIGGMSIRNRLSWWYPTRYVINAGSGNPLFCNDVRDACS